MEDDRSHRSPDGSPDRSLGSRSEASRHSSNSDNSSEVFTVGGRPTLTRLKYLRNVTTSDGGGDSADASTSSISSFTSPFTSLHHAKFYFYEWDYCLPEEEKKLVFKFLDRNRSLNFNAVYLMRHGATFPYINKESGNYDNNLSCSAQNRAMTHFLLMMDLGEKEERRRDEYKKEKRKYRERQIQKELSQLSIQEPRQEQGRKIIEKNKKDTTSNLKMMKTEAILPNEANIWNKCLVILQPTYAAEVFYSQGVNLVCVTSLKAIYEIEAVSSESFTDIENIILEDNQVELVTFLKVIVLDDMENQNNKHFMDILCSKIYKDGKYTTYWKKKTLEFRQKNNADLVSIVAIRLEKIARCRNHTSFNERDLQSFLLLLMNDLSLNAEPNKIKSYSDTAATIEITQLRQAKPGSKIQSQKTTPDVEYWEQDKLLEIIQVIKILICELKAPTESTLENWKSPMETEMHKGSLSSTKVKCTLLWTIYEAIFGTMMKSEHDEEMMNENHVVFQGGMLVCNDRMRSVVLAVNAMLYSQIRQKTCARETFMWIKENPMWARLYIEGVDHHILDALSRAKYTHNNFCKCVPSMGKHAILL